MTDIVERLRSWAVFDPCMPPEKVMEDAANEIERLRQDLADETQRWKNACELTNKAEQRIKELEAIKKSIADMAMKNLQELAELRKTQGEPIIWIAEGHLREVSNGNILNCYCSPEKDRFAEVPLYTKESK